MPQRTDDLRIENLRPLLPPAILMEEHAATDQDTATVVRGRDEVARILDCPVGTVASRLYRARRQLFDELADYAHPRGGRAGRS